MMSDSPSSPRQSADLDPEAAGRPLNKSDAAEPLIELTLGRPRPSSDGLGSSALKTSPVSWRDELLALETRCRSKAEVARWAAEDQRRLHEGIELSPAGSTLDPDMSAWAEKLFDGFYWSSKSTTSITGEIDLLDQVGGCFEAVAESLAYVRASKGPSKAFERALHLLAEAQSALRQVLLKLNLTHDPEQEDVFQWVRTTAARSEIYVPRYMRADDPADPASWLSLLTRIEEARSTGRKTPSQSAMLKQLEHHQKLITEGTATELDWDAIVDAVDALIGDGLPPSSREIRELLLPIVDAMPDRPDLPKNVQLVVREIDRFLATRSPSPRLEATHEPTEEVKRAADLLRGKSVVLIGGDLRREAQESLRKAFELESLIWLQTKEHQSVETLEPLIARPEVALVLLAIRFASHGFGDAKQFCENHGKPLVRLPGGYSPNQVAAQILMQCSEQLRG
jgi:hypothetical protein